VEHQEISPENTRTVDGLPLFFRLHAGWWLSSLCKSACNSVRSAKKFVSVGKLSGDFTPHKRARNSRRLLLGSF
jgi:hypothetical protein